MSKVIKTSQVTGKYKINQHPKALSFNGKDKQDKNSAEHQKSDKHNMILKKKKKVITEAEKKAKNIVVEAEEEAKIIIQKAEQEKKEIEAAKDEIYAEIKENARNEGLAVSQKEIDKLKSDLAILISNFEKEFSREKNRIRKDIIELAVKIASIVIDVKLEKEHELINNIIFDMLNKIDDNHSDIVVRINPQLVPYVEENRFYEHINQKNIEFISDPELKKGDCVVETNLGGKEGSLEHKLDLIRSELLKEVEQYD